MSGTENEAVQAGALALHNAHCGGCDDSATTVVRWYEDAKTVHDAMREIIAREVIAGVCRREGHLRLDTTSLDSVQLELRCGRCGETWNEPRPKRNPGGPVLGMRSARLYLDEKIVGPGGDRAQG